MEPERDLITGQPLPPLDDEPVRQFTEKLLLDLGYGREQISVDANRELEIDGGPCCIRADLLVWWGTRPAMVLRCAYGSLVTREKEAVCVARVIGETMAPLAVVINGVDAELLDTATGKVLATGIEAVPGPRELQELLEERPPQEASAKQVVQAARVYMAFGTILCPLKCEVLRHPGQGYKPRPRPGRDEPTD